MTARGANVRLSLQTEAKTKMMRVPSFTRRVRSGYRRTRRLTPSWPALFRMWFWLALGLSERRVRWLRTGAVRELRIQTPSGPRSVFLRSNGIDAFSFWEVLVAEVYGGGPPLPKNATIIDAGANIGLHS